MAACAAVSLVRRWPSAARLSIVGAACEAFAYLDVLQWPASFLAGLAVLPLLVRYVPALSWLRPAFPWLRRGAIDRMTAMLIGGVSVVAGTALVLWFALLRPDVRDLVHMIPPMPKWALPFAGLGFSAANAVAEEAVYRGVALDALDAAFGAGVPSVLLQAVAFGCLHLHGFPRGVIGVVLAATFGLMLGAIWRRARGMLAPWLAHVFADVAIVAILVVHAGLL
jgi:hypothetical protein